MRLLHLKNAGVRFNMGRKLFRPASFWVLPDVSLSLYQGETLGVLGRNAAGKSTLLKLLAGIIDPDRGVVERTTSRSSLLSLQTGFMPHLTGRENAVLSGILQGMRKADMLARMDHIVEFSELGDFIDQPLGTYSSGMCARLGFAVAMQVDPDILMIDEVLGVGDEDFRRKSADAITGIIRSNKTVVLVSHNPSTIRDLCDRAVWIEAGKTRMEGPAEDVITAYQAASRQPHKAVREVTSR